jgi:hypothetical protein
MNLSEKLSIKAASYHVSTLQGGNVKTCGLIFGSEGEANSESPPWRTKWLIQMASHGLFTLGKV